jgi:hypothetical protein
MSRPITQRMLGALRLDAATYEEVEADQKATGEAAFIVVAVSLVAGTVNGVLTGGASGGIFAGLAALLAWAFSAWVTYIVGVKLFPGPQTKSSWGEIARTLGYAYVPRFFVVLELVPSVLLLAYVLVVLWVLAATVVALRAALDVSTGRALAVAMLSGILQVVIIRVVVVFLASLG